MGSFARNDIVFFFSRIWKVWIGWSWIFSDKNLHELLGYDMTEFARNKKHQKMHDKPSCGVFLGRFGLESAVRVVNVSFFLPEVAVAIPPSNDVDLFAHCAGRGGFGVSII